MKVLIFGATGMLGSSISREYSRDKSFKVFAVVRSDINLINFKRFAPGVRIIRFNDFNSKDDLKKLIGEIKPNIIFNCLGVIKQKIKNDISVSDLYFYNSYFPKMISYLIPIDCSLVHFSTDCVFSGNKGNYTETDFPDPVDDYGYSKYYGEIAQENCVTIRTSIIGHGLLPNSSLIDWFLAQNNECYGYINAIYSGFPTNVLAKIIKDNLFKNGKLLINGVFHLSSESISKLKLLERVSNIYKHNINIIHDDKIQINRTLSCNLIKSKLNIKIPTWDEMILDMYNDFTLKREC